MQRLGGAFLKEADLIDLGCGPPVYVRLEQVSQVLWTSLQHVLLTIKPHVPGRFKGALASGNYVSHFLEDLVVAALNHAESIVVDEISLHIDDDQRR